jgi:hypothetical protein
MSEVRLLPRICGGCVGFCTEQVGELASKRRQQTGGVVCDHISFKRSSWNYLT